MTSSEIDSLLLLLKRELSVVVVDTRRSLVRPERRRSSRRLIDKYFHSARRQVQQAGHHVRRLHWNSTRPSIQQQRQQQPPHQFSTYKNDRHRNARIARPSTRMCDWHENRTTSLQKSRRRQKIVTGRSDVYVLGCSKLPSLTYLNAAQQLRMVIYIRTYQPLLAMHSSWQFWTSYLPIKWSSSDCLFIVLHAFMDSGLLDGF